MLEQWISIANFFQPSYRLKIGSLLSTLVLFSGLNHSGLNPISSSSLVAQQIQVATPLTNASNSYYERMGVNFGFNFRGGRGTGSRIVGLMPNGQFTPNGNLVFQQGGMNSAIPQFGGYDPNANARFGFSRVNPGGGGFSLGFDFGQGSSRSMTSTTPSVMVQNGHGGSITSGAYRPYVTGIIPVSGNYIQRPTPFFTDNAVTRAIQSNADLKRRSPREEQTGTQTSRTYSNPLSSAQSGDISVAKIKAQRAQREIDQANQYQAFLNSAAKAEAQGDFRIARINFRQAIKRCLSASEKEQLRARLAELRDK